MGIYFNKKHFCMFMFVLCLVGCQTAYYSAMEKVGKHKRDIMLDRVENAQDAQKDAQEEFSSALEQLSELIEFDGGDLAAQYEKTNDHYEASKLAADNVEKRIVSIENVADALFEEWTIEIEQYSSQRLKRQSESQLKQTKRQYLGLIKTMYKAHERMAPVLSALKDNSLYLKHNLNARAIGAIQGEYKSIKADVDVLLKEMNQSINQSQAFIDLLNEQQGT